MYKKKVVSKLNELARATPHLTNNVVSTIIDDLIARGIVVGGWDKRLYSLYGVCSKVLVLLTLNDVFLGCRFSIWGWDTGDGDGERIRPMPQPWP